MKLTFLFLLISSVSFSQRWSYEGYDKSEKFGHEYWFSFQNEEDTNSFNYSYSNLIDSNNVTVTILDNNGEPIPFATIEIRANFSDIYTTINTGTEGTFSISQDYGEIEIKVHQFNYDSFETVLDLDSTQKLDLTINLGLGPNLQVYQINSKKKLKESEVELIIGCVKNGNRNSPSFGCEQKRKYNITMHI